MREFNLIYLVNKKNVKYTHIIPNIILRGSLFGVIRKGKRRYESNVLKTVINNLSIRYTGEQLDQSDLDVWLECLKISFTSKREIHNERIYFSTKSFLKNIGRNTGKSDREWLYKSFKRMMASIVEISYKKYAYIGQLLIHWNKDELQGRNSIVINRKLIPFFKEDMWTGIIFNIRYKLRRKQLSQWLYCFFSTHLFPLSYKIHTLQRLSGSTTTKKEFKRMIRTSLLNLSLVTGWKYYIKKDLIKIIK